MTKIDKAIKFMDMFRGDEDHEIWMVGGAVRDMVLGVDPADIDFSTLKTPEVIKEILMEGGVFKRNIDMKDANVGTVVVTYDDEVYEITTFRTETYSYRNRRPVVEFTQHIYEDAIRRDFNINSIYFDGDNFFDPMGGLRYSKGAMVPGFLSEILTTNKAEATLYAEDPLRILRYLRFNQRYMSTPGHMAEQEMVDFVQPTLNLSFQTFRKEIEKGFKVLGMYRVYRESQIFSMFIPYFSDTYYGRRTASYNFPASGEATECWAFLMRCHVGAEDLTDHSRTILIRRSLKMMEFSKEDIESIVAATGLENQYLKDDWKQRTAMERLYG